MHSSKPSPVPADLMPLMRVAEFDQVTDMLKDAVSQGLAPSWQETRDGSFARKVQKGCLWSRCTYFYAGQADSHYGNLLFVYWPAMEKGKEGEASPYDSGGVYRGKCDPFRGMSDTDWPSPNAVAFLKSTAYALSDWREYFAYYLDEYFVQDWQRYCLGQPPSANPTPLSCWESLPARFSSNFSPKVDWPSWSWEVRVRGKIPLAEGLFFWSAVRTTMDTLGDMLLDDPYGAGALLEGLFSSEHTVADTAAEMVDAGRKRSIEWVTQQLNP